MKALLVVVVTCCVAATAAAEPLGRLFFTPEQRAHLDRLRRQKPPAPAAAPEAPAEEIRAPAVVTYSGLVRKSDGRPTVWINNRAVYDGVEAGPGSPRARLNTDGSATIVVPQQGSVKLKVGQTAEVGSGQVAESYMARRPEPIATEDPPRPAPELTLRLRRRFDDDRRLPPDSGPP